MLRNGLKIQWGKYKSYSGGLCERELPLSFTSANTYMLFTCFDKIEKGNSLTLGSKPKIANTFEAYAKIYNGNSGYERDFFALAIGY